jgi:transposase
MDWRGVSPSVGDNPLDGAVYVFRTRAGTTLKLLAYDGQGFWLCTKRSRRGASTGGRPPRVRVSPSPPGN